MLKILLGIFVIGIVACKNGTTSSMNADDERKLLSKHDIKIIDSLQRDTMGVLQWIDSLNDLKTLKEGEVAETVFKFKNAGKTLLVLKNVSAACGCTVPKWPVRYFKPGEIGEIVVTFNSAGKASSIPNTSMRKDITVTANTFEGVHKAGFNVIVNK
jgi:uncharacterized cupredoxin-like copper-binding protein